MWGKRLQWSDQIRHLRLSRCKLCQILWFGSRHGLAARRVGTQIEPRPICTCGLSGCDLSRDAETSTVVASEALRAQETSQIRRVKAKKKASDMLVFLLWPSRHPRDNKCVFHYEETIVCYSFSSPKPLMSSWRPWLEGKKGVRKV